MIAKTTYGSSFKGALLYGEGHDQKGSLIIGKSELLHTENVVSRNALDLAQEMQAVAKLHRAEKIVMHTSLSWKPGEKITNEQMVKASLMYCEKMGASRDNHQIVIYRHHDQAHPHCHVYINRVPLDRSPALAQSNDYVRNVKACRQISEQLGFETVVPKQQQRVFQSSLEAQQARQKIQQALDDSLKQAKSFSELKMQLEEKGIQVRTLEKQGKVKGISFRVDNYAYKGTAVGYKAADIEVVLVKNQQQEYMQREERNLQKGMRL